MEDPERLSHVDAELRLFEAVLAPVTRIARVLQLSLDDLTELVSIQYYRELRARKLSWVQIARHTKKSRRTIGELAKRERSRPLDESRRLALRRSLIHRLGRGPTTLADLRGAFTDEDLEEEVELLLDGGILQRDPEDRLHVAPPLVDLVGDDLGQRVDSLRHFLDTVSAVVYQRFLARDREPEAFARVLSFSATRERLRAMEEEIYAAIERAAVEADEEATDHPAAVDASVAVCFVEAPTDRAWRSK
ncbi:MAG: hypothetical protein KC619_12080 [Myxococcales bacterium]|nr:hypothetical protein [Myxococcales bacterium]